MDSEVSFVGGDAAQIPVAVVRRLVDGRLLDHFIRVDGHGSPDALVRALQAVVVGSEYVHLAGHPRRREVGQVLAALLLLVDLALMAIVAAIPRLRTATETRTKGKKTNIKSYRAPRGRARQEGRAGSGTSRRKGNFPTSS